MSKSAKIRDRIKDFRRVKASELFANPHNWREHPESQQAALLGVLEEIGYADALLARELPDGTLEIVDGHLRKETTPDQEVPVLILDIDEDEAKKLLAVIDPLAAMAEANTDALGRLLAEIGTESDALQTMLDDLATENGIDLFADAAEDLAEPEPQIDRAAELQEEWGTETGQLWVIPGKAGEHRLLCGDSTKAGDVARVLGGERAGLLLTDPPYGISVVGSSGKIGGSVLAANQVYSPVVGDDVPFDPSHLFGLADVTVIWGANYFPDKLPSRGQWIVWDKGRPEGTTFSDAEIAWTSRDGVAIKMFRCVWHGMTREGETGPRVHPTQKPIRLMANVMGEMGGGIVLDLYLGSGTTMVAAEQLSRICYGIEISPAYCGVILQRMKDMGLEPRLET